MLTAAPINRPPMSNRTDSGMRCLLTSCTSAIRRPTRVATTASTTEKTVGASSYRMVVPGTEKPIMPMKCMSQIPTPPMDNDA